MFSTIIDFVQNNKRIKYPTSLDPFSSKDHLIRLIEGYIAEIEAFQNDENRYVIPNILTYEPSAELTKIDKIFSIIEMDKKIYPRMYIYLHINFNTIRDAYKLIDKCDEAIRLFNEFKDRVNRMTINTDIEDISNENLKSILDTMNPVIGPKDVKYSDEIYDFFDESNFKLDVIIGFDDIFQSCQDLRSRDGVKLINFHDSVSIGGFVIAKSDSPICNVDVVDMLLNLMRSNNVSAFWMKEINDTVIKKDDYRDSWGFFGPQAPAFLKIQIPDNIRQSMYKYIKFLTEKHEEYGLEYIPEVEGRKSTKYAGMSHIDEFLYGFNDNIKDLLYDVYTHATLVKVNDNPLSKEKFDRLLGLIDKVHGGMDNRHIVVKSLLYYNILIGNKSLDKLLKLFELMFSGENCSITRDEIASIVTIFVRKYFINSKFDDRDTYEKRLVSMTFCCKSIEEVIDYLTVKKDAIN